MLQLYGAGASPFVRKARVLLAEAQYRRCRIRGGLRLSHGRRGPRQGRQPLGKIPSLVRDNGPTIYDSNVICRFLDDHAGGHFYPRHACGRS
jgi:glutathione S-transferase